MVGMAEVTIGLDENGEGFITDYGVNALVTQVEQGTAELPLTWRDYR